MSGQNSETPDETMVVYGDESDSDDLRSYHDPGNSWDLYFNSSIIDRRNDRNTSVNSGLENSIMPLDFDLEEIDKWMEATKYLNKTASATNSIYVNALKVGYADVNYRTEALKAHIDGLKPLAKYLKAVGFVVNTYDYNKEMSNGNYRKGFSIPFDVLVLLGIAALPLETPFLLFGLTLGAAAVLDHYDVGERIYDFIDKGDYSPEPGVFYW